MTIFGQTLDGQQLFGLISLVAVLAFWIVSLNRERDFRKSFRAWEAGRKARKDAEDNGGAPPGDGSRGPWG